MHCATTAMSLAAALALAAAIAATATATATATAALRTATNTGRAHGSTGSTVNCCVLRFACCCCCCCCVLLLLRAAAARRCVRVRGSVHRGVYPTTIGHGRSGRAGDPPERCRCTVRQTHDAAAERIRNVNWHPNRCPNAVAVAVAVTANIGS